MGESALSKGFSHSVYVPPKSQELNPGQKGPDFKSVLNRVSREGALSNRRVHQANGVMQR